MENNHTIHNKTPYTWYYRNLTCDDSDNRLPGHSSRKCTATKVKIDRVRLKYGNHSDWDLRYEANWYGFSFNLRESNNRQRFELVDNKSGNVVDSCPNFARLEEEQREKERREKEEEERKKCQDEEKRKREEEERRRREEEERRRQAQLERERRIQQQIDEENQASRQNLTQAYLDLQEEQNLRTRRFHQEQTVVLHQVVEDHTAEIQRDEDCMSDELDKDVDTVLNEMQDRNYPVTFVAGSTVSNLLDRTDTQSFFTNQVYKHQVRQTFKSRCQDLPEAEKRDLQCYVAEICDVNHPATEVDILVLTQSEALQGKGIKLIVVDKDGKKLSQDYYPGMDESAGDIVLQLRKEPKKKQRSEGCFPRMIKWIHGEQSPFTGHFEIVRLDGSVEPVYSEGHNCLYHAVAQATSTNPNTREEAAILRNQVRQMLLLDVDRYAPVLKLQRGYESSYTSSGKYLIIGGDKKTREEAKDRYKEHLNTTPQDDLTENDASVIKTYKLGMVGTYNDIKVLRKENGSVNNNNNADHIPPINTFQKASQMLDQNSSARQKLQQKNPKLYQMMDGKGTHGLCREVLTPHHQLALTTGNGKEAHLIRQMLAEKFVQGDVVTGMKMSLMASNPEVSQRLRTDADVISEEATRRYHDIGDKLLVEKYSEMGVIDWQGKEKLNKWLKDGKLYSTNTPVYRELLNNLRELKKSLENRQD